MGLGEGTPGYAIVNGPRDIAMVDHGNTRMSMLMGNFFDFGRGAGNWTWQSTLAGANGPDSYNNPANRGINLLNGTCTATNCDGFRQAFYNLATHVINIPNIQYRSIGPIANGGYLTHPGTTVVDGHWLGNVRTEQQTFAQLQVFKFSEHHFLTYGGQIYDPTANATFANEIAMKWCMYTLETNALVKNRFKNLRLFRITDKYPGAQPCNYQYLVEIGSSGGWPTNLLTAADNLNFGALAAMSGGVSRT
jgi:hypothetical protein